MIGERFGKLVVISKAPTRPPDKHSQWNVQCDCGRIATFSSSQLRHKGYKSCGCLKGKGNLTHGLSQTPMYRLWATMLNRCNNPNNSSYKFYGGRGIKVCEEWLDFECFKMDVGIRPDGATLERMDNNLGYKPNNVKWATRQEQARNTKRNRYVDTPKGKMLMLDAVKESGLPYATIQYRLNHNWPAEKLFNKPGVL